MLSVLRSSQPLAFVIVTITWMLGLGLHFFAPIPDQCSWCIVNSGELLPKFSWISNFLLLLPAIALHRSFSNNEFAPHRNSLAVWLYILFGSFFCLLFPFHHYLLAQTFIALALHQMWQVYRQGDAKHLYFNATFFIGCSALIVPNTSWLFIAALVSLAYTRSGIWREWAWSLIGFILPATIVLTLLWFNDSIDLVQHWTQNFGWQPKGSLSLSASIPLSLLILWGVKELMVTYSATSNKSRNTKTVALFMALAILSVSILELSNNVNMAWFFMLPVSSLLIPFIVLKDKRTWWMKLIFWALLLWTSLSLVGVIFNFM